MEGSQTISAREVPLYQRTLKQKYANCVRNDFLMPTLESSIIRNEYMDKVFLISGLTLHFRFGTAKSLFLLLLASRTCQKAKL